MTHNFFNFFMAIVLIWFMQISLAVLKKFSVFLLYYKYSIFFLRLLEVEVKP